MIENEHRILLERIREDRIAVRRALALEYVESPDPDQIAEKILATQRQIDAIERAIASERGPDRFPFERK